MKKILIIPVVIAVAGLSAVMVYDKGEGYSENNEGITRTIIYSSDSTLTRGHALVKTLGYDDKDLNAIFTYLETFNKNK